MSRPQGPEDITLDLDAVAHELRAMGYAAELVAPPSGMTYRQRIQYQDHQVQQHALQLDEVLRESLLELQQIKMLETYKMRIHGVSARLRARAPLHDVGDDSVAIPRASLKATEQFFLQALNGDTREERELTYLLSECPGMTILLMRTYALNHACKRSPELKAEFEAAKQQLGAYVKDTAQANLVANLSLNVALTAKRQR